MPRSLSLLFAGSGEFGIPALSALLDRGHQVVRVISQPDRPAGRGRRLTPTPIARLALARGLPLVRTERIADEVLPPADAMVVIAFGQKVPDSHVNHSVLGSVNLHASLLPKYRGAAPIHHAVLAGETRTGNSVIRLAQKMDAGAILGQTEREILPTATTGELHGLLAADGAGLVVEVVEALAEGRGTERAQDEALATLAPKLSRESARLDLQQTAERVRCQINGLSPWPGCRVRVFGREGESVAATLLRAGRAAGERGGKPGRVSPAGELTAGDGGAVQILEIQPESKRPMNWADFRNGFGDVEFLEPVL